MKRVSMSGSPRESVGKKDAKKVRTMGHVPCVMYGGDQQIHFTMDERDFNKLVFTPDVFLVSLSIDGKEYPTIIQEVQYHPVTDKVLHADFLQVVPSKPLKIALPVRLTGSAVGVVKGGRLIQRVNKLLVSGMIDNIPDFIEIDVTDMNIGDLVKVEDMERENLKFLDVPSELIVAVRAARKIEEELEDEDEEGEEGAEGAEGGEGDTKEGGEGAAEEKSE